MRELKTFREMYNEQIDFQNKVVEKKPYDFEVGNLPEDNVKGFSFHVQQLMSEIGEILNADKRWKNYRNDKIDFENKKEEIADCFIVLMNIAIFSGLDANELENAIFKKINKNEQRIS